MTRKTCTNHPHVDIVLQSVCHELNSFDCYGQSKNVKRSRRHKQDISPNLLNLRHLYRTDPAVALFLKINGIDLRENWPDEKICSMTRNRMTRSQTNSVCCKTKSTPGGDYAHRLRTRRHTVFTSNFADTSGDDDSNHIKPMRELRSSSRLALALVKSVEREERSNNRPRRNLKPKRISADERLVVDNKSYYKVELLTNKLRSSAVYNRELDVPHLNKKTKSSATEFDDSDDDKVTFSMKIPDYELIRLNNEAENFLFPNKEEATSDDEVNSDKKVEATPVTHHRSFKNVKCEPEEESSMDSIFSDTSTSRKKRRLTQAESFILDNQKYYKFETPGSRLRYQGSYLATVPPKSNGEHGSAKLKCKESKEKEKEKESKVVGEEDQEQIRFNLQDVKFSFELVPKNEPWYETFQRQDVAQECYSCYNYNTGFYKPFLMPYEMGPLPPLDPNYCMYEYNLVRQPLMNSESKISNDDSSSNDTLKIDECSSGYEDTKSSDDTLNSEVTLNELFSNNNLKRTYRRRLFNSSRNPRKSPRQHASTLAILSSFIHQRKRREIHKQQALVTTSASPATPKPEEKLDLSVIAEVEEKKEEPPVDYDSIFNDIDEMLMNDFEELDDDDLIPQDDGFEFNVHCGLDPVEMLEDCIKCKHKEEALKDATKEVLSKNVKSGRLLMTGRKTGRKRKKNRTGWPNKNKRVLFRKDDNVKSNNSRKVNHAKELQKLLEEIKTNDDELNGNVEPIKINGCSDLKNLLTAAAAVTTPTTPKRKENRVSSSENCAEVVIASMNDKLDCVNVDLDKWENAERVLSAKLRTESINNDIQFQPIVRVQKMDTDVSKLLQNNVVMTTTPARKSTKKSRRMPASPKSPKMFRKPRGACYRERYSERIHYN